MQYDITPQFSLEPIKTELGYQIQWGCGGGLEAQKIRTRWNAFSRKHINTRIVCGTKFYLTLKEANQVCRDFIASEKKRADKATKAEKNGSR